VTTNVVRPDGTTSAGDATFTGGATWQAVTADDSDASYAELGTSAVLTAGTFTLDSGNVTKQARVRARCRSVTGTQIFSVITYTPSGGLATLTATATTTITTYTSAYSVCTLTQADIDGLVFQVIPKPVVATDVRFVELYIDVIEVGQPTTVISAPTGTVTTSSPTATFSYTQGSDGGAKTHHRIKVFTDAVFDGGGFDPDTSTAIYDSGEVASSSTSVVFGPVADGTDHHLHVKVAQTINSNPHWSAWDEQIFTLDTNGPDVTSITAVATSASGFITVTVNRNTGGAAWDTVTVERSEDAGTTWLPVRGATETTETNTFATFAANTFTVIDYEAPNGTSVVYRARGQLTTQVGAWSSNSASTSWSSTSVWLKNTADPTANVTVAVPGVGEYSLDETRTQSLQFQTSTANGATALESLLGPIRRTGVFHVLGASYPVTVADNGDILLLQYPASFGLDDLYVAVTGWTRGFVVPARDQRSTNLVYRLFNVDTVEVDRPADTTSG
jgi:hypothetical protein